MNLNGQCESAFNEWMKDKEYVYWFMRSPHEMQHGVKVKFFDSVGINISVFKALKNTWFYLEIEVDDVAKCDERGDTRHEAQTKAEQEANDIYNENN